MELVASDVECGDLGLRDPDALVVDSLVERAFDFEAGPGGGRADQLEHRHAIGQGMSAPVLGDAVEQAVLDLVPLRGARWVVASLERQIGRASCRERV